MLFAAAAVTGAVTLLASSTKSGDLIDSAVFHFARAAAYIILNVYAIKMAAVFMFSTSTVVIYTGIPALDRLYWISSGLAVLIGSYYVGWSFAVLPVWVLLVSAYILTDNSAEPIGRSSRIRRARAVHPRDAKLPDMQEEKDECSSPCSEGQRLFGCSRLIGSPP